jgi:hypothetical protein
MVNLITTSSDHYAILIALERNSRNVPMQPVQHGFRFEAMWLSALDYKEFLENAWAGAGNKALYRCMSAWAQAFWCKKCLRIGV